MYLSLLYCIKAVACRLYEMLYPCSCNVVISCWKTGAYGIVICRGGTNMCFVSGSGWKHLYLEQYRILSMCGCTLHLGSPHKNSDLGRCSTRQPTVYSYTASHRSPCIRVDSPTLFYHHHHDHYHPDSHNSINIVSL